ncbi:MAG: response regulator [Myxococcales bacterium]|nr:response regulator [Myxococcales bacterium]
MPSAIIIDDSSIMRGQIRQVLKWAGFEVTAEADSADDLVALYERHRPDLVSLDIVMPGRDGAAAAIDLLGRHPQAVVVMCTSMAARDQILACQKAGVSYYLLKPFNPAHAAKIYRAAVERARERPQ